jgi:hypothetical protein
MKSSAWDTLVSSCTGLEHLDLQNCRNVNDATLMKISLDLKMLFVDQIRRLKGVGIAEINLKCSKLQEFDYDFD